VILMNPPFGGKEGKEAQTPFAYKTGATQVLFLQHVIASLKVGGSCGMVIDEGVLSERPRPPSFRPSASCSMTAICGASCHCLLVSSRRRELA